MHLAEYRESLRKAEAWRQLSGRLWTGGIASIVFGCLAFVEGVRALDTVCMAVGFWIIGAAAIAEGVWVMASPRPAGLLAEAVLFLFLALLNGFAFFVSVADPPLKPDILAAGFGALQFALAIWYVTLYRKFSWLGADRPPIAVKKWIASVSGAISKADFRDSPYLITLRHGGKRYKAALLLDSAVVVETRQGRLGRRKASDPVYFAGREEVAFADQGKELTTDRRKGRFQAGDFATRVSISPASLERLEAWLAAAPEDVQPPADLPEPPVEELEEWRLGDSGAPAQGGAEPVAAADRNHRLLAELELPPDHPASAGRAEPAGAQGGWSGSAIASFVLGLIVCLGPLTALPAVILGHLGLRRIRKSGGRLRGRGLAITGLILGYVVLAFSVLLGALSPALRQGWDEGLRQQCASNMKNLAVACRSYADDHDGRFPDKFSDLYPRYVDNLTVFTCPATWEFITTPDEIDSKATYILWPTSRMSDPPETPLMHEPEGSHGGEGHHVVYVSGEVKWRELPAGDTESAGN